MSGYNKRTGWFSLTQTKARHWCRHSPDESIEADYGSLEYCFYYLKKKGFKFRDAVWTDESFVCVKADPDELWEALSGQPSDPNRSSYYY